MGTGNVPVRVTWSAATDAGGSGAATYDVARSTDGGALTTIATQITGTSYSTTVSGNHTHRFQVRARDWAGNVGPWKPGTTLRVGVTQQTSGSIAYTGSTWPTASSTSFTGGSVRYSTTAGAKASYLFTGRGVAFVSTRGPNRGSANIYIDGTLAATVSLYHSSLSYRYVAFQKSWSTSGSHRISVVVAGTAGHPRVDVDAFEVVSTP